MNITSGVLLGALASNDTMISRLINGAAPWLGQYVGPIAVAAGIVAIIIAVVQLVRYISGKSNGGGQSRVSIGWTIGLFVIGGALAVGGLAFTQSLVNNNQNIVNEIGDKADPSYDFSKQN